MIKTARSGDGRAEPSELEKRLQLGKSTITVVPTGHCLGV
jgi:hypothetical protein